MYDPILGRFASVDPIIQFPDNSQSFNGYGYCLNNPLKYTDSSGMLSAPANNINGDLDLFNSSVGAISQYFAYMTDVTAFSNMSFGGGVNGKAYYYDSKIQWYRDEKGNIVDWDTYIAEIAPTRVNANQILSTVIEQIQALTASPGTLQPQESIEKVISNYKGINGLTLGRYTNFNNLYPGYSELYFSYSHPGISGAKTGFNWLPLYTIPTPPGFQ